MKTSCLPVSRFPAIIGGRMSIGEWVERARHTGLDGVDISLLFLEIWERVRETGEFKPVPIGTGVVSFSKISVHQESKCFDRRLSTQKANGGGTEVIWRGAESIRKIRDATEIHDRGFPL